MRTKSAFQASQCARINPPSVEFAGFAGIKFLCSTFSHSSNQSYQLVRPMMGGNSQNASESNQSFANVVRRQLFHPLVLVHNSSWLDQMCNVGGCLLSSSSRSLESTSGRSQVLPFCGGAKSHFGKHKHLPHGHLGSARAAAPPTSAVVLQLNTRGRLDPNVCLHTRKHWAHGCQVNTTNWYVSTHRHVGNTSVCVMTLEHIQGTPRCAPLCLVDPDCCSDLELADAKMLSVLMPCTSVGVPAVPYWVVGRLRQGLVCAHREEIA